MSHNLQKRKHNPSGSSTAKKQKATKPTPSPDVQLLTRIITKTEQPLLQRTLLASITSASQPDLDALKRIFGPLVASAQTPLHCVRCHKSYLENENNHRSCVIEHHDTEYVADCPTSSDDDEYDSDNDYNWGHPRGQLMKFTCCGERVREKDENKAGPCIQMKHTTDPKEVEYYVQPSERKQTERQFKKWEATNPNVVTCEDEGCSWRAKLQS
ncbi:hypothetical protein FRC12_009676 [Ceratobasidium sp. 428]|nr:hypothetical protein FRC12_009676 [Ceratobasidium sp. 428]